MSKYKAIVTTAGAAKIAAASAGGMQLKITHMAVGDGNGTLPTPDPEQAKLVNEKYRATLNTLTVDRTIDNHIIAELIIPANVGGFWLREMGLYDDTGALIAVSNMAESYKPQLNEGSGRTQTLRMVLIVSSTEAIKIIAGGDTVLATRDFVDDAIKEHEKTRNHPDASTTTKGFVQLSSATTSSDETKAATPKAIKDVNDGSVKKADNLSDLKDKAEARKNLALGTAATKNVGTEGGNVMQVGAFGLGVGPQHRDNAYSNAAQIYRINGTSVSSPGSGVYGVVSLPCDGGPSGSYLAIQANGIAYIGWSNKPENGVAWTQIFTAKNPPTAAGINAADARNNFAARMGVDRVLSGGNPPSSPGVWSVENCSWTPEQWGTLLCTSNRADLNTDRGNGQFYHYFFLSHSSKLYVATNVNNSGAGWQQLIGPAGGRVEYLDINKGLFIGDGLKVSAGARVDKNISVGEDLWVDRDLYVTGQGFINKNSHYDYSSNGENHRQTNGLHLQGAGNLFADIYHHEHIGKYHELGIHVANGGGDGWFGFRPDGALYLNGPGPALGVGAAKMASDGNIFGSRWGNKWLWDAITEQLVARDNNINTRATWDYVNQNFVRDIRLASRGEILTDGAMTEAPWGAVITGGNGNEGNQVGYMYFRYLQKNVNGNWYTVAYA